MEENIKNLVLNTFKEALISNLGASLREIILFGSQVRGDEAPDSDYDVLVIAEGSLRELKNKVNDAEWICMEKDNALVSSIIYTPEIWESVKESTLG